MSNSNFGDQTGEYDYYTLGTLCDEPNGLTCSFDAARRWGKAQEIKSYPTFEQAAEAVKESQIESFLVPCAYPKVGNFIMDDGLKAGETFLMQIPDLVLVGLEKQLPKQVEVIYHHPATEPLLKEVEIDYAAHEHVTSNSKACVALRQKASSIAITNQLCAMHYELQIYQVLRPGIVMPFVCFIKAA